MDDAELVLDGNALGGLLAEVFVADMTTARIECRGCGAVEAVAVAQTYTHAPGIVARCRHCERVLLVVTRRPGSHVVGFPGVRWLEIVEDPRSPSPR